MVYRSGLLNWIEKLDQARVLVLGDIMLDRFIYGDVSRISPEGPVPVLKCVEMKSVLGGAGNVARNLAALGAQTYLISIVGPDPAGEEIRTLLSELSSVQFTLITGEGRSSTVKTRYLSRQQQLLRVDTETADPISENTVQAILSVLHKYIDHSDVVVFSDYAKGILTPSLLKASIAFCRTQGKKVLVDPKSLDYSIYRSATLLTPNLKELADATRMAVKGDESVIDAARQLIGSCDLEAVLATRSQDGMSLIEAGGNVAHFKAEAKEVFDVTGAGDTVMAVLAAALAVGAPLAQSAEISNIAAGIVVGKAGTAVTYATDMIHAIRQQELSTAESKVLDLGSAMDRVELWRRKGYRIGFISGFFELLHPAHIRLVTHASKACDRLIVGINSDASVFRLKGEEPILHEAARSAIIGALEDVDAVILFEEDTPAQLIESLHPDVLIKTAGHRSDPGPGTRVKQNGSEVMFIDLQEEFQANRTAVEYISGSNL